jgi:hypothetical protein
LGHDKGIGFSVSSSDECVHVTKTASSAMTRLHDFHLLGCEKLAVCVLNYGMVTTRRKIVADFDFVQREKLCATYQDPGAPSKCALGTPPVQKRRMCGDETRFQS